MTVEAIIAIADNGGVGLNGRLPWPKNSEDLRWFKEMTTGKICIVGHNTNVLLPPLFGRIVVPMKREDTPESLIEKYGDVIVIGGPSTYKKWQNYIDRFYIARIRGEYEADTFMKEWMIWTQE